MKKRAPFQRLEIPGCQIGDDIFPTLRMWWLFHEAWNKDPKKNNQYHDRQPRDSGTTDGVNKYGDSDMVDLPRRR